MDWQSAYISALEDGTVEVNETCKYDLRDLDSDGIPELFCYDDSIRTTYMYAIVDGSVQELICRWSWNDICINGNLLFSNDPYSNAIVYKYEAGKVEELFAAQHVEMYSDTYYYEGNVLNYDEVAGIVEEYFGAEVGWKGQGLVREYDKDSIRLAIAESSSGSSSEKTVTRIISGEYYGNILTTTEFTLDDLHLNMKDEENGIDFKLKVADDCRWSYYYIQEGFGSSYQEMYEIWEKFPHYNIEKLDEYGYEWGDKSIKDIVENGEIVEVVFKLAENNNADLEVMLSYYWEAVNSN